MFDNLRARWDAATRARLLQVLDRLPGEEVEEAGTCHEPDGLLFVTDQRLVLQDHDEMTETSVPWDKVIGLDAEATDVLVVLTIALDSPAGEPSRLRLVTTPDLAEAVGRRAPTAGG